MKINYNINFAKFQYGSNAATVMKGGAAADSLSLYKQGLLSHQQGRLHEAKSFYEQCLALDPKHTDSLHLIGVLNNQWGNPAVAIEYISKAIELNPKVAVYHSNLGGVFRSLGQLTEALDCFDRAVLLDECFVDAHFNRAVALGELDRLAEALASYAVVIQLKHNHLQAHFNSAKLFGALGDYANALNFYQTVLEIQATYYDAHIDIANIFIRMVKYEEAVRSYDAALAIDPSLVAVHVAKGHALCELKRYEDAFFSFKRAIDVKPDCAEAFYGCGLVLDKNKHAEQAVLSYQRAMAINPNVPGLLSAWLLAKFSVSNWYGFADNRCSLLNYLEQENGVITPFLTLAMLDVPALQKRAAASYIASSLKLVKDQHDFSGRRSEGNKRIKIGYYSANFNDHPVAYLTVGVLECHNTDQYEIIAFSFSPSLDDPLQKRIVASVDRFIDVSKLSIQEIVGLSRDIGIDIAIDLMGYTEYCRCDIFVHRCAPVQVNYLGYPGTSGHEHMDYIIADQTIIPGDAQQHYSEKVVYMPNCHFVYSDPPNLTGIEINKSDLGLPESGFVFCCFNNSYKLLPPVFDSWMRILNAVHGSVLMLAEGNETVVGNLRREAELRGVDGYRLIFVGRTDRRKYLARYRLADLFLDTFCYNAGTTAADALWTGLPVLTCIGESFAARMASGLVKTAGLSELITQTPAEYESVAIALANDPVRFASIRAKLSQAHDSSPLFDVPLFTKHLERAYSTMFERHCIGLAPDNIYVPAG